MRKLQNILPIFFHKSIAFVGGKVGKFFRLKETSEIYKPSAMCGPCLDPNLNKPTVTEYFRDNWRNLNVD